MFNHYHVPHWDGGTQGRSSVAPGSSPTFKELAGTFFSNLSSKITSFTETAVSYLGCEEPENLSRRRSSLSRPLQVRPQHFERYYHPHRSHHSSQEYFERSFNIPVMQRPQFSNCQVQQSRVPSPHQSIIPLRPVYLNGAEFYRRPSIPPQASLPQFSRDEKLFSGSYAPHRREGQRDELEFQRVPVHVVPSSQPTYLPAHSVAPISSFSPRLCLETAPKDQIPLGDGAHTRGDRQDALTADLLSQDQPCTRQLLSPNVSPNDFQLIVPVQNWSGWVSEKLFDDYVKVQDEYRLKHGDKDSGKGREIFLMNAHTLSESLMNIAKVVKNVRYEESRHTADFCLWKEHGVQLGNYKINSKNAFLMIVNYTANIFDATVEFEF